jgi:hypothetical protein
VLSRVDVVTNQTHAQCAAESASERLEISAQLFDPDHVHEEHVGGCPAQPPQQGGRCRCREVAVAAALLAGVGAPAVAGRRAWAAALARQPATGAERPDQAVAALELAVLPAQAREYHLRVISTPTEILA